MKSNPNYALPDVVHDCKVDISNGFEVSKGKTIETFLTYADARGYMEKNRNCILTYKIKETE